MARFNFKTKDKLKSVKSQVTMLIIIGLLLFVVVSLVLYLSKSAVKKQTQKSIKEIQETAIETQSINGFIENCINKLAKDAIVFIGKHGGYLYRSQGGTLIDFPDTDEGIFFVRHDDLGVSYKVAYNIFPPRFVIPPYYSEAPLYPWPTFPYSDETSTDEIFEGFFGLNTMPPLYIAQGPHSMQENMEVYVDNHMADCAVASTFEQQGFDITIGQSDTSVVIRDNDITIKSKMPTTITNKNTQETTQINDFSTSVNLRLKTIYYKTNELVNNDVKNVKFDISEFNEPDMELEVKKDIINNDDLIIIKDKKSIINGKPFEYVFARKNRIPALWYIRPNLFSFADGYEINEKDLLGDPPKKNAEDPDEDSLTFNIYIGETGTTDGIPHTLTENEIKFNVNVSDGALSDAQILTVVKT